MTTIQTIPLNKLIPSKANVRRTDKGEGLAELAQSIATHGLRQNLNVKLTEGGKFEVVAGGRRFRALKLLAKQGAMPKTAEVPCNVLGEEDDAAEISLVENTLRVAMHADDQFEAFNNLVQAGKGVEEVAARFGVTPFVVERRLKLARVSPKLRALFRAGELTLDQMMAFAVSDDHDQQEKVYGNLGRWCNSPRDIRAALTQEAVPLTHGLAKFVTEASYIAAGGVMQRDLFDEGNEGYMPDRGLVLQLAAHKLEAAVGMVEAEGWKWVKAEVENDHSLNYGRVYPDYEEGEDGERVALFSDEDKARAGAILRVGRDGELDVTRGLVHPDDVKAENRAAAAIDAEQNPKEVAAIPASVVRELSAHRTAAIRLAMAENPHVALAATVHALALPFFGHYSYHTSLDMSLKSLRTAKEVSVKDDCKAHSLMDDHAAYWGERLPSHPADLFAWCLAQEREDLLNLLAYCAACSVNALQEKTDNGTSPRLNHAAALAESLELDMAANWTPSVEGFYGKLSKAGLLMVAKDAGAELTLVVGNVKKLEAARDVMQAVAQTPWLPPLFRKATAVEAQA